MLGELGPFDLALMGMGGVGFALVLLKLVLAFAGADGGSDFGGDVGGHDLHADTDSAFAVLSLHTVSAFFMMFGLVGFALRRANEWTVTPTIIVGAISGAVAVWAIRKIFTYARKLQSSGNISIEQSIGQPGTVYMRIPAGGVGVVHVTVNGARREYSAKTGSGESCETGSVVAISATEGSVLVVTKKQ